MILGRIVGKSSTKSFRFQVEGDAHKFHYVQVMHSSGDFVLAQVEEIEKDQEKTIAFCNVIGYKVDGKLCQLTFPLDPSVEVLLAEDDFVRDVLGLEEKKSGAYIGTLDGRDNLKIYLDLNKVLTKHVSVLAMSGSGKCLAPDTEILLNSGEVLCLGRFVDDRLKKNSRIEDGVEIHDLSETVLAVGHSPDSGIHGTKILRCMRRPSPPDLYRIQTRTGKCITITAEHQILLFNGDFCWRQAQQLQKGEYLLLPLPKIAVQEQVIDVVDLIEEIPQFRVRNPAILQSIAVRHIKAYLREKYGKRKADYWTKVSIPLPRLLELDTQFSLDIRDTISCLDVSGTTTIPRFIPVGKDFAKLLGYMLAEGHNNGRVVKFLNQNKQIQQDYINLIKIVFGLSSVKNRKKEDEVITYSRPLALFLQQIGFTSSSWTKFIPREIFLSDNEVVFSFLSSFSDGDGHVSRSTPVLSYCLASKDLVRGLERLFLRLGIVPMNSSKVVKGRTYARLVVSGSLNLRKLPLSFHIPHKMERLRFHSQKKGNPNVDIVPNLHKRIERILRLLRSSKQSTHPSLVAMLYHKHNFSRAFLQKLIGTFKARAKELEEQVDWAENLDARLVPITMEDPWNVVIECRQSYNIKDLAASTSLSPATISRILHRKTALTNNIFKIASFLPSKRQREFQQVSELDQLSLLVDINCLLQGWRVELKQLYRVCGVYKQYLYHAIRSQGEIPYPILQKINAVLQKEKITVQQDIPKVKEEIRMLERAATLDIYYDEITAIQKISSPYRFVYDLETASHNFTANHLIVHNSYSVSVLLEEVLKKKVPVVVIDAHGEYSSLKFPNPKDKEAMIRYGVEPKGFLQQIEEYSPDLTVNPGAKPLKLSSKDLSSDEMIHLLPTKLSSSQLGLIYAALKNLGGKVDFQEMIFELEASEDSSSKWTLINIFQYVERLQLFSQNPTLMGDLVKPGKMAIINLKGVDKAVQEMVVYKLVHDLFRDRKRGIIPPFFLVVEECHNFVPERSFGEAKSSSILRQVAAEGRKFGLGLCFISQRPSRVDKSALSQCSTQFILKVTNPNDVKAVSNSVEGITAATEKEIQSIPVGTALVTGIVGLPLFVNVRPRMSKHGGEAVQAFIPKEEPRENFSEHEASYEEEGEALPIIRQQFCLEDVKLMHGDDAQIQHELIPAVLMLCSKQGQEFSILIDLVHLQVIEEMETVSGPSLLDLKLQALTAKEETLLDLAVKLGRFTANDLFGKSGLQFSELHSTISTLLRKGYFVQEESEYKLSPHMEFLSSIDRKQFYQPIVYLRSNAQVVEAKYKYEIVQAFFAKFFVVNDVKECWVEKFTVLTFNRR